jgi:serine/threonine protein kinase
MQPNAPGVPQPQAPQATSSGSSGSVLRLCDGRYILKERLGSGSFGEIYRGYDVQRRVDVAIKMEQRNAQMPQLAYESRVYQRLTAGASEIVGVAYMHYSGLERDYVIMVIDLLGPNLEDLLNYCMRRFSLKTVLMLGEQMMYRIEHLHVRDMLHRDIKPENFAMGLGDRGHHVYILDFGLSKRYRSQGEHIPFREGKPLTGTARYCSVNAHRGFEQSRRDDLEAIGFVLVYFLKGGKLPWQGLQARDMNEKTNKIGQLKMSTRPRDLCYPECPNLMEYFTHVRDLEFRGEPNYRMLRNIFRSALSAADYERDCCFDWIVKREEELSQMQARAATAASSRASAASYSSHQQYAAAPSPSGV